MATLKPEGAGEEGSGLRSRLIQPLIRQPARAASVHDGAT